MIECRVDTSRFATSVGQHTPVTCHNPYWRASKEASDGEHSTARKACPWAKWVDKYNNLKTRTADLYKTTYTGLKSELKTSVKYGHVQVMQSYVTAHTDTARVLLECCMRETIVQEQYSVAYVKLLLDQTLRM
jgi:hypothetical protein